MIYNMEYNMLYASSMVHNIFYNKVKLYTPSPGSLVIIPRESESTRSLDHGYEAKQIDRHKLPSARYKAVDLPQNQAT